MPRLMVSKTKQIVHIEGSAIAGGAATHADLQRRLCATANRYSTVVDVDFDDQNLGNLAC